MIMASKLERVLLRYSRGNVSPIAIREVLFCHLDARSMRTLRVASRPIKDLVDARAGHCFSDIYVDAPLGHTETTHQLAFLHAILPVCYSLTITLQRDHTESCDSLVSRSSSRSTLRAIFKTFRRAGEDEKTTRGSTARASMLDNLLPQDKKEQNLIDRRRWIWVFEACRHLRRLTVRVHGDPGWPDCTEIENQLVQIRCALEEASMPTTPELCFVPIHAMGLVHFRWSSFGAFGSPMPVSRSPLIWHKLRSLEIQLRNPFINERLSGSQARQFKQLLYSYFRSFASTLQRLTFVYLDSEGTCPLALHQEPELCHKAPLRWCELVELRLGNIKSPHETLDMLASICPQLERVKMLRSQYRYSFANVARADERWLDVRLLRSGLAGDRASSIYSQASQEEFNPAYLSDVSLASREVPFMLDLRDWEAQHGVKRSGMGWRI